MCGTKWCQKNFVISWKLRSLTEEGKQRHFLIMNANAENFYPLNVHTGQREVNENRGAALKRAEANKQVNFTEFLILGDGGNSIWGVLFEIFLKSDRKLYWRNNIKTCSIGILSRETKWLKPRIRSVLKRRSETNETNQLQKVKRNARILIIMNSALLNWWMLFDGGYWLRWTETS